MDDVEEILAEEQRRREELAARRRPAEKLAQTRRIISKVSKKSGAAGLVKKRAFQVALRVIVWGLGPYILIGLAVLGLIIITVVAVCNADQYGGALAALGGKIAAATILPEGVCSAFANLKGVATTIDKATGPVCQNPELLASQYGVPPSKQNDPDLDKLVSCIRGKVQDVGEVSTWDKSRASCNYTRGVAVCDDKCSHAKNSCHYGGAEGGTGAQAVDFGKQENGPAILKAAQECSASLGIPLKRATCEAPSEGAVSCRTQGANHVHISIAKCDRDNGPINSE